MAKTWHETQRVSTDTERAMGRLLQAVVIRDNAQRAVDIRAFEARMAGISWEQIGSALGMTKQGAQQRYSGGDVA